MSVDTLTESTQVDPEDELLNTARRFNAAHENTAVRAIVLATKVLELRRSNPEVVALLADQTTAVSDFADAIALESQIGAELRAGLNAIREARRAGAIGE